MKKDKLDKGNKLVDDIKSANRTMELIESGSCIRIAHGGDEIPVMGDALILVRSSMITGIETKIESLQYEFDNL